MSKQSNLKEVFAPKSKKKHLCESMSPQLELEYKREINDISNFLSKILKDDDRLTVLNKLWMPPKSYAFPPIGKYKDKNLS